VPISEGDVLSYDPSVAVSDSMAIKLAMLVTERTRFFVISKLLFS